MKDVQEKKSVKGHKNLAKYLHYFKNYKGLCLTFWFLLLVTGVIGFFSPLILGKVISYMTVTKEFDKAITYAIYLAALETGGAIVSLVRVPFFKKLENYVM